MYYTRLSKIKKTVLYNGTFSGRDMVVQVHLQVDVMKLDNVKGKYKQPYQILHKYQPTDLKHGMRGCFLLVLFGMRTLHLLKM